MESMSYTLENIQFSNYEYDLMPIQFFILTFWGIWYPKNCSMKLQIFFYWLFWSVIMLNIIMCIEMTVNIVNTYGSYDFKIENIFFTTGTVTGIYKAMKIKLSYTELQTFIGIKFDHKLNNFHDPEEDKIHENTKSRIRRVTLIYGVSMFAIFFVNAMAPMVGESGMNLPVDASFAYSIENKFWFWSTYLHQFLLGSSLICVHIGVDTLFVGLLLEILCHMDVLQHRLRKISTACDEYGKNQNMRLLAKSMIYQWIDDHAEIYRLSKDLNNRFQGILTLHIATAIPNLCINVYILSVHSFSFDNAYIAILFNTSSSLLELFITCWFGNELTLHSLQMKNKICEINWTALEFSIQKLFVLIMARSLRPIRITIGDIPMNLESFLKIIKTSYSAFNLLQRTSK